MEFFLSVRSVETVAQFRRHLNTHLYNLAITWLSGVSINLLTIAMFLSTLILKNPFVFVIHITL